MSQQPELSCALLQQGPGTCVSDTGEHVWQWEFVWPWEPVWVTGGTCVLWQWVCVWVTGNVYEWHGGTRVNDSGNVCDGGNMCEWQWPYHLSLSWWSLRCMLVGSWAWGWKRNLSWHIPVIPVWGTGFPSGAQSTVQRAHPLLELYFNLSFQQ